MWDEEVEKNHKIFLKTHDDKSHIALKHSHQFQWLPSNWWSTNWSNNNILAICVPSITRESIVYSNHTDIFYILWKFCFGETPIACSKIISHKTKCQRSAHYSCWFRFFSFFVVVVHSHYSCFDETTNERRVRLLPSKEMFSGNSFMIRFSFGCLLFTRRESFFTLFFFFLYRPFVSLAVERRKKKRGK